MKRYLAQSAVSLLYACALSFSGCAGNGSNGSNTTGTPATNGLVNWWNSPTTQTNVSNELNFLNTIGQNALNVYLESQINPNGGGATIPIASGHLAFARQTTTSDPSQEVYIQNAIAEAKAKCPHLKKSKIESSIRAQFYGGGPDKRSLTKAELGAIKAAAFQEGVDFAKESPEGDAKHAKALLVRRMAYRYRVTARAVKPTAEAAFDAGAQGSP